MKTTIVSALALAAALACAGAVSAQDPAVGGPTAKGNAPVKKAHTINDGAAKGGRNSFTEAQARQHIINAGYLSVSGLKKGSDGVWRGMAARGDTLMNVALDFKGNVTEAGPAARGAAGAPTAAAAGAAAVGATAAGATAGAARGASAADGAARTGTRARGSGAGSGADSSGGLAAADHGLGSSGEAPAHGAERSTTGTAVARHGSGRTTGAANEHHSSQRTGSCSTHPGPNGVACSGVDRNVNGVSDREDRARR